MKAPLAARHLAALRLLERECATPAWLRAAGADAATVDALVARGLASVARGPAWPEAVVVIAREGRRELLAADVRAGLPIDCEALARTWGTTATTVRRELRDVQEALATEARRSLRGAA